MKAIFLLLSFFVFNPLQAQEYLFEFKTNKFQDKLNYQVYQEIKEQVDNERTRWDSMFYNLQVKSVSLVEDTFHLRVCYDRHFINLFFDSESSGGIDSFCIVSSYDINYQDTEVSALDIAINLNQQLLSALPLASNAKPLLPAFTMEEFIKKDIQGLCLAFRSYDEKEKNTLKEEFLAKLYQLPDFFEGEISASLLGNFNQQKHLKELSIVYEYMERTPKQAQSETPLIQIERSSHLAFNTRIGFTEIFQEFKSFDFFYPEGGVYSLSNNYIITRINE